MAAVLEGTKKRVLPRAIAGDIINEQISGVHRAGFSIVATMIKESSELLNGPRLSRQIPWFTVML